MIRNHFSMLPEMAFQPRGRYGMTLEGVVEAAFDFVGDVVGGAVDIVQDIGSSIDDFVNEEIPGGWGTVAVVGGGLAASGALSGAASTGAAAGGGAAELASVGATGAGLTAPITAATVPSAFDAAVTGALTGGSTLGTAGPIGTAGFGTALPPATEIAAGLTTAGFAPGTAANLAGLTAAGTGATNLLGGATALAPIAAQAPAISIQDALRGARLASGLLSQPQDQQIPAGGQQQSGTAYTGVDYSALLNLLAQRPSTLGLLGTRFQPQSVPLNLLG